MKKVLFVVDTLEVGGSEKSMLEMLPYFQDIKISVCYLYPGGHLRSKYEAAQVNVYALELPGKYSFLRGFKTLSKIIDEVRPDIVHSALLRSSLLVRLVCLKRKFVHVSSLVADSYNPVRISQMAPAIRFKFRFFYLLDRLTARWIDYYVANSHAIKNDSLRYLGIEPERIEVIYRGRDVSKFHSRDRSHINHDPFVCITVGRLILSKGHQILIDAFCDPQLKTEAIELWIVGDGPERPRLERAIELQGLGGKVKLLGRRDDVSSLLKTADLFLFPSLYEGLGGAIIEAMLAGIPTVCSNLPVFHELIQTDITGRFAANNPKVWAMEIKYMYTHSRERLAMGLTARNTAIDRFDIKKIAAAYENFYRRAE